MNIQNIVQIWEKIVYVCYINTTICLQYFSVSLRSNPSVYCFSISYVTEK